MAFPERFKEIRIEQGLTQEELADKIGISTRTWQRYEKGKQLPGGFFLIELVMMGYNLHWLFTGDGDKYRDKSPAINPDLRKIWEWLEELTEKDPGQKDWFRIEFAKRFPEFEDWLKSKK